MLTSGELATALGVSKGRVSQYVAAGQLEGCFQGDGRQRRFDLTAAAQALGKNLDRGQMLGNGAATKARIAEVRSGDAPAALPPRQKSDAPLIESDSTRYDLARTQKTEEEARALRRRNAADEGLYVLASEVERQMRGVMAQELAEVETVLRDGARMIADKMGVDFREVRQMLVETWRAHRTGRSDQLAAAAPDQTMTQAEMAADV